MMMTQKEFLDVMIRIAGVFALLWGLWDLTNAALFYTDYFRNADMTYRYYLIYGWVSIGMGLLLLRGGAVLADFAYPPREEETGPSVDAEDKDEVP